MLHWILHTQESSADNEMHLIVEMIEEDISSHLRPQQVTDFIYLHFPSLFLEIPFLSMIFISFIREVNTKKTALYCSEVNIYLNRCI